MYKWLSTVLRRNKAFKSILYNTMSTSATSESTSASSIISICHMRTTNDKENNKDQVKEIVQLSKEKNANFVFLPECCDFVGSSAEETLSLAEPLNGDTVTFYKTLAKDNNLWLSIGGFHELVNDRDIDLNEQSNKIYNSHLVINNDGNIVANYRKIHLFDVDTPEFKFRESKVVKAGEYIIPPLTTPIGSLGLLICYDLRFPELSTILRKRGANILTYPSAFAFSTGKAHWEILLRSRAIENQCFVIASAQIGYHNTKRQSYGHAIVVDPWGKIIAQCDNNKDIDVVTAEINLNIAFDRRKNMPCFDHRRSDIYSLVPLKICQARITTDFIFESFPIPTETIFYESEHSIAFTNIRCVVPGHVLVVTREKIRRLKHLKPDEITDFFQTVCKVQKLTEDFYGTSSSTVTVQDGEDAGQTVRHVHCHIMPRRKGDFAQNDEIYIELNKHDLDCSNAVRRPVEEMIKEAIEYKKFMATIF